MGGAGTKTGSIFRRASMKFRNVMRLELIVNVWPSGTRILEAVAAFVEQITGGVLSPGGSDPIFAKRRM